MRNRRLYQLMALLTDAEVAEFEQFLRTPLLQPSKKLVSFFELWVERVQSVPETENPTIEGLLKGSDIPVSRFNKYCSHLSTQLLNYLAFIEFQASPHTQWTLRLEALEKRAVSSSEINRQRTQLQNQILSQGDSAKREIQLLDNKWKTMAARIQTRENPDLWKEEFGKLNAYIDGYYTLQKLKLSTASVNASHVFQRKEAQLPDRDFLEQFRNSLPNQSWSPLILAYYHCLEMLVSELKKDHFLELLTLLKAHSAEFDPVYSQDLYGYALNFCIRKSNQGELEYREHGASLYRDLLENGLILSEGKISSKIMKNIVVIHCVLGHTEWVRNFLTTFKDRVEDDQSGQSILYNEAILAFYERDYPLAIQQLTLIISELKEDVFYQIDARAYLWKSYFEYRAHLSLEEVDKMYKLYDSFRIFIDRNQLISQSHKQQSRNFIREFRRFMILLDKEPVPMDQLQELYTEVEQMQYMGNKGWFLEKINEYLNPSES